MPSLPVAIAILLVFGAMLLFDTAALLRLGWYCVAGGCGLDPTWLLAAAIAAVLLAILAARLRRRRRAAPQRPTRTRRAGATGTSRHRTTRGARRASRRG